MCCFCNNPETIDHLFFNCPTAKYIWCLIALVLGANHRPTSFGQYWQWVSALLPSRKHFHMIGLAVICCAIWKTRNSCCFEKKTIKTPTEIICLASSFLNYWAGLQAGHNKEDLEAGAAALLKTALHFHAQANRDDTGMVLLQ